MGTYVFDGLGICPGVNLLSHLVATMFNFLSNCQAAFHRGSNIFTFPTAEYEGNFAHF